MYYTSIENEHGIYDLNVNRDGITAINQYLVSGKL